MSVREAVCLDLYLAVVLWLLGRYVRASTQPGQSFPSAITLAVVLVGIALWPLAWPIIVLSQRHKDPTP